MSLESSTLKPPSQLHLQTAFSFTELEAVSIIPWPSEHSDPMCAFRVGYHLAEGAAQR